MIRFVFVFLLLPTVLHLPSHAAASSAEKDLVIGSDLAIGHALSEAIKRNGVARIEVTLDLNEKLAPDLDHPAADSDVHPTVFDIAMMAARGPMALDQAGTFHRLHLTASEATIGKILEMKEVVAVHLSTDPVEDGRLSAKSNPYCQDPATMACFPPYAVTAGYVGAQGKLAAEDGNSAAFWTYSPNNWEILVKVLDGCDINDHIWLLASAASTSTYSVSVLFANVHIGTFTATNKPIVNFQLRNCHATSP